MKRLFFFLLALLTVAACFTGCEIYPEYEYTDDYVRVEDPCGQGWLISTTVNKTEVDGVTYRFEREISQKDRAVFIDRQTKICRVLADNGISVEGLNVYVLRDVVGRSVGKVSSAYMDDGCLQSAEQIRLTLEALLGEYTNYGYLYALSQHIAGTLGWDRDSAFPENKQVFLDTPLRLNLFFPCFTEAYSSLEQINACKALSVKLISRMSNPYAGEGVFASKIKDYAKSEDIDFSPTYLSFAFGGGFCPVKMRTEHMEMYLDSEYEGSIKLSELTKADDAMFNLEALVPYLEYADDEIKAVKRDFGDESDTLMPVYVKPLNIKAPGGFDYGGVFYAVSKPYIELGNIYEISLVFSLYLNYCAGPSELDWCANVLASYHGAGMSYFSTRLIAEYDGSLDAISNIIGEPYNSVEDHFALHHWLNLYNNADKLKYSVTGLPDGHFSFSYYFVGTYGERNFIDVMIDPEICPARTGRTVEQILDDWCAWCLQFYE